MPYRPPLVPHETFVADPVDLPVRPPGQQGLSALARTEVLSVDQASVALKGTTTDGVTLVVEIGSAGEGVIRVRLSQDPYVRSRSARAANLVTPRSGRRGPRRGRPRPDPRRHRSAGRRDHASTRGGCGSSTRPGGNWSPPTRARRTSAGACARCRSGRSTVDGAVVAYHESFTAAADEHFVGLGEKFTGFDKRGQRAVMWNYDAFGSESDRAYKNVPFYLSSRGYGVLVDSGMATEFDLCQSTHSCVQILVPDDLIDYYVIAGPTPAEIIDRFDRLTGRPALPPKWAFGAWISSGFLADTQDSVLARARTLRERGDPVRRDAPRLLLAGGRALVGPALGSRALPGPDAGCCATWPRMGFRICLWMNSYVSHLSPYFAEAAADGHFLKRADGTTYVADVWHGTLPALRHRGLHPARDRRLVPVAAAPAARAGCGRLQDRLRRGRADRRGGGQRHDRRGTAQRLQPALQRRRRRRDPAR